MSDYAFLDETNCENVFHCYETLKPSSVTTSYIDFTFPPGSYVVDCVYLKVKFDEENIASPNNNFSIENFIDRVITFYDKNIADGQSIRSEFIAAYTNICKLNKPELCFVMPLIKLISIDTMHCGYKINKTANLRLSRRQNRDLDSFELLKCAKDVDLDSVSDKIMDMVSTYVENKISYEIVYRRTKFFDGMGKLITPQPFDWYVPDKFDVEFNNSLKKSILIADKNHRFDYKNLLLITNFPEENSIEEVELRIKYPKNLVSHMGTYGERSELVNGSFKLTKEFAELFGHSFKVGPNYYLIDISKFIKTYVHMSIDNNLSAIYKHFACDSTYIRGPAVEYRRGDIQSGGTPSNFGECQNYRGTSESFEEKLFSTEAMHRLPINEFIKQAEQREVIFDLELNLTLKNPTRSSIDTYAF